MEYRTVLTVASPRPRAAMAWDALDTALRGEAAPYGPVTSYWPDRDGDRFEVTMSTSARDHLEAAFTITSAAYPSLRTAGLDDCHIAAIEVAPAQEEQPVGR